MKIASVYIKNNAQETVDLCALEMKDLPTTGKMILLDTDSELKELHIVSNRSQLLRSPKLLAKTPYPARTDEKGQYKKILSQMGKTDADVAPIFGFSNAVSMRASRKYTDGRIQKIFVSLYNFFQP